ncbi:deoxyribodipyrimidine photo-lyase [Cryobacterium sp. PAMC25264]|nr:deoxyribodipyrimidine photo-lyase [Cryobacterium sp. PAMC25264]
MSGTDAAAAPGPARPDGPSLVWLRDDLRLGDNPALTAAVKRGRPLVLVYVLDEVSPGIRPLGGASKWWLHQSLTSLAADTAALGGRLVLRRGPGGDVIDGLVDELGAGAVFWNRRYGQAERDVDTAVKTRLTDAGIVAHSFAGSLLFEPWTIKTGVALPTRCSPRSGGRALTLRRPGRLTPRRTASTMPVPVPTSPATISHPGDWSPAVPTGRAGCARRGRPARARRRSCWRTSSTSPFRRTAPIATSPPSRSPRGCRRTCAGAKSARTRSGTPPTLPAAGSPARPPPAPPGSSPRWAGGSSHTTCSSTRRIWPRPTCAPASTRSPGRRWTSRPWPPGSRGAPASVWSTPVCVSCGAPAPCTTGCAWSRRRS